MMYEGRYCFDPCLPVPRGTYLGWGRGNLPWMGEYLLWMGVPTLDRDTYLGMGVPTLERVGTNPRQWGTYLGQGVPTPTQEPTLYWGTYHGQGSYLPWMGGTYLGGGSFPGGSP